MTEIEEKETLEILNQVRTMLSKAFEDESNCSPKSFSNPIATDYPIKPIKKQLSSAVHKAIFNNHLFSLFPRICCPHWRQSTATGVARSSATTASAPTFTYSRESRTDFSRLSSYEYGAFSGRK